MTNLEKYYEYQRELKNYEYALFVLSYDEETDCPRLAKAHSLEVFQYFENKYYDITLCKNYEDTLFALENDSSLDKLVALSIKKECKNLHKLKKLPKDLFNNHLKNLANTGLLWEEARESLDYSKFESALVELVSYNKKYIEIEETKDIFGYNVLLDEMEEGSSEEMYDEFFSLIEKRLVPFIQKIIKMPKKFNTKLLDIKFPISKQRELTEMIIKKMGYSNDVGCIRETIHPFTAGVYNKDIRITTSYDESLLLSNLYSIMHETGHALYELQNDDALNNTSLRGGASMALHESQSRFYENYVGRNYHFIKALYPILKDIFKEELKDISLDDLYYYANNVEASLIRTEADELTYPIHILIRYKIEKMLFHNEILVKDIDRVFNELMEKYLGIKPKNKKEGCYQDIHWSSGFGYFPTYAFGSAIAAQIYYKMQEDINFNKALENMDFKEINLWLKDKIHKYGASLTPKELIINATGEEFNPNYYLKYLISKFSKIYEVSYEDWFA